MRTSRINPYSLWRFLASSWLLCLLLQLTTSPLHAADRADYFEIQLQDAETGRGIPLIELVTVHHIRYVTDSAGRIAFFEPGLMDQPVFFDIQAPGYAVPKDGLGVRGVKFQVKPGGKGTVKLKRINLAERLYRCTGLGIYRDSVLLGYKPPIAHPLGNAQVAGQDSVLAVPYRGKLYWFWGDTSRAAYPLGLFRMSGATSPLPGPQTLSPALGVNYTYFTDAKGFSRAMAEVANPEGVVWLDGICTVKDSSGRERLVAHYSRRKGLGEQLEHGMMLYNDNHDVFEVKTTLPLDESWRFLKSHPVRVKEDGREYFYCGNPCFDTRVPATLEAVLDPQQYQSFSCIAEDADPKKAEPLRNPDGTPAWHWGSAPPVSQREEARWLKSGLLKPEQARFSPADVDNPAHRIQFHTGTVNWNPYRQRWIVLSSEFAYGVKDSPSTLGEVWYSESESPTGPFAKAVRVITHDKMTFYNTCQHPFFDEAGGRLIYFEGTYASTFTNEQPTQLYDYNQIMYRLDLDTPKLRAAFPR